MGESWWFIGIGMVIGGCAVVLTATVWVTARKLRQTLQHVNTLLNTTSQAAGLIERSCRMTSGMLDHMGGWMERAQALWTGRLGFGNGATRSHRHHRTSSSHAS